MHTNIRETARHLTEAVMIHLVITVSKDTRVVEDPNQFGAVLEQYKQEINAWQEELDNTPQAIVEIFAKAGVIVDRIE